MDDRACTCHPDDDPPVPCAKQYALLQCRLVAPVAWRVECRWKDRARGGGWRKYADYGTLKAAETSQQVFSNPGDIESRIVPLYTHAYIVSLQDEANSLREANTKLVGALDMIRETLNGGNVEDLLHTVNEALAAYREAGDD